MHKRLLLLSNSTNPGEKYLAYPAKSIRAFLGPDIHNVLFIPYAGVTFSHDEYTEKVSAPFKEMGYSITGIHRENDPVLAVENAAAIAVGGGNTWELLTRLYGKDLIRAIRKKVHSGTPYIGWSAGSNVACPTIKTTNDMPITQPPSFEALHLIPFQINPHYTEETIPNHGGESRDMRIREFIAINKDMPVACLPEGTLLRIEGNNIEYIGKKEMTLFRSGNDPQRMGMEQDLGFLLNS